MRLGLSLATLGVAVSVAVVAVGAHYLLGLPWELAVLLGAVTSPTDAAAVFSVLRVVPLPRRLDRRARGRVRPQRRPDGRPGHPDLDRRRRRPRASSATAGIVVLELVAGIVARPGGRLRRRLGDAPGRAAVLGPLPARGRSRLTFLAYGAAAVLHALRLRRGVRRRAGPRQHRPAAPGRDPVVRRGGRLAGPDRALRDARAAAVAEPDHLGDRGARDRGRAGPDLRGPAAVGARQRRRLTGCPGASSSFLSWAGLRGAVPIVLTTIPLAEGVDGAERLFDIVFVMVVIYTLLTGPTLPLRSRSGSGWPAAPSPAGSTSRPRRWSGSPPTCCRSRSARLAACTAWRSGSSGCPRAPRSRMVVRDGQTLVPERRTVLRHGDDLLVVTPAQAARADREPAAPGQRRRPPGAVAAAPERPAYDVGPAADRSADRTGCRSSRRTCRHGPSRPCTSFVEAVADDDHDPGPPRPSG